MKRPSTAVQAALTGHLLISTLHANDAIGAIARLDDLGVDSFKIGGALLGSVAQRLFGKICTECKELVEPNESLLKTLPRTARTAQTPCSTADGAARSVSAPATRDVFRSTKS